MEPIPSCSRGEILAVDLNHTSSCCPRYHCGKCQRGVPVCVPPSPKWRAVNSISRVTQFAMPTCAPSPLWAARLASLWFKPLCLEAAARSTTAVRVCTHSLHMHAICKYLEFFFFVCVLLKPKGRLCNSPLGHQWCHVYFTLIRLIMLSMVRLEKTYRFTLHKGDLEGIIFCFVLFFFDHIPVISKCRNQRQLTTVKTYK